MIIDSSPIMAAILQEPDAEFYARQLVTSQDLRMSASAWLECCIALTRKREFPQSVMRKFLVQFDVRIVPVDFELADMAASAFRLFGKGRHAAQLNFGDCFSYALAKISDQPLLCKGNDFVQTDLVCISAGK